MTFGDQLFCLEMPPFLLCFLVRVTYEKMKYSLCCKHQVSNESQEPVRFPTILLPTAAFCSFMLKALLAGCLQDAQALPARGV